MRTTFVVGVLILLATTAQAQWLTGAGGDIYYNGGAVGIGTTNPVADLHIVQAGDAETFWTTTNAATGFAYGRFTIPANSTVNNIAAGFFFQEGLGTYAVGNRFWQFGFNPVTDTFAIAGGAGASQKLAIAANGNVGIGTASPTALLDVNGSVNVTGNIAAKYQDVAEWVTSTDQLEPGTVVVLNPEKSNEVMASVRAYDSMVAGVVSYMPGLILGEAASNKEQIATSGRVKVRVDATKNAIRIGDLLVTGERPGTAIKSEPVKVGDVTLHRPGTIIGKALQPLEKGEGEILVLLSLQ